MIRCYITDRRTLAPGESLSDAIARNIAAGVDWIQIREKDWSARELGELVRSLTVAARKNANVRSTTKIIVNTRMDVAIALGADGVHFPGDSPAPKTWRRIVPARFLMGISCHTAEEVREAESGGADYVLFGPVYAPISKDSALAPRGLHGLAEAASAGRIPVLALGGITVANTPQCLEAGAAGVAGISLFQKTF